MWQQTSRQQTTYELFAAGPLEVVASGDNSADRAGSVSISKDCAKAILLQISSKISKLLRRWL